jgi:hypothetical protein
MAELLALMTEEWREKLGGRRCHWHYTSPWHDFSALLADFDDVERLGGYGCGRRGNGVVRNSMLCQWVFDDMERLGGWVTVRWLVFEQHAVVTDWA